MEEPPTLEALTALTGIPVLGDEPDHRRARGLVSTILAIPSLYWGEEFAASGSNRGKIFLCRCVAYVPGESERPESTERWYFVDHTDENKILPLNLSGLKECTFEVHHEGNLGRIRPHLRSISIFEGVPVDAQCRHHLNLVVVQAEALVGADGLAD